MAYFSGQGFQNKDLTVWLDGVRTAYTCFPPSFPKNAPAQPHAIPTPKNTFASLKQLSKFCKIILLLKNQRKSLTNSLLPTLSLSSVKFYIFTNSTNLVSMKIKTTCSERVTMGCGGVAMGAGRSKLKYFYLIKTDLTVTSLISGKRSKTVAKQNKPNIYIKAKF